MFLNITSDTGIRYRQFHYVRKSAKKYGKKFFKEKTVELGMLKKGSNKLVMSNGVYFNIPNSL